MTKYIVTHDDVTDACELSLLTPYPIVGPTASVTTTTNAVNGQKTTTINAATDTVSGIVQLATAANYPIITNDVDAVTPAYLQAALAAAPVDPIASATVQGRVALATAAEGLQPTNELDAATPAYVKLAIDALPTLCENIAALPVSATYIGA